MSFQELVVTIKTEVARIDGALSFRAWDEVEDDFGPWHPVDSFVTSYIAANPLTSTEDIADILSGNSVCNLSNETALAIVRAARLK
jgi:hypothetical protein